MASQDSVQFVDHAAVGGAEAAARYFAWVDQRLPGVSVSFSGDRVGLHMFGIRTPAIELQRSSSDDDVEVYDVCGGFLVARNPGGEFRFERQDAGLRIALTRFEPFLPQILYRSTHYIIHELVMASFCRTVRVNLLEGDLG